MKCIFTVDIEDWFHILDIKSELQLSQWEILPTRVENNFNKLLDIFSETNTHVTCFFLGWIAKKFPHLVRAASSRGHEIASHGYSHRLVYELTEDEFLHDAVISKKILEDISGKQVLGYRCPGFSYVKSTPWFFKMLIEAGYIYDSSVFPASRGHGGIKLNKYSPYMVYCNHGHILEFPITIIRLLGQRFCFSGGGYLRIAPYFLINRLTLKVLREGRPAIFYIHPREIDLFQPRLPMNLIRRFKTYVNLKSTEWKIRRIINEFEFTTFEEFIDDSTIC